MSEKRDLLIQNEHIWDMQSVLGNIYNRCCKEHWNLMKKRKSCTMHSMTQL